MFVCKKLRNIIPSKGVVMRIRGNEQVVRGRVLFVLADTLAAHSIGGFKMGVGFSLRKYRMCLATKEQISMKVCCL